MQRLEVAMRRHSSGTMQFGAESADDYVAKASALWCFSTRGELAQALRSKCEELDATALSGDALGRLAALVAKPEVQALVPAVMLSPVDTAANRVINYQLGRIAATLVRNRYRGVSVGHSRMLLGPRGSGKTVALLRFALTASMLFPTLRVVYINAHGCGSLGHPLNGGLFACIMSLGLRAAVTATASPAAATPRPQLAGKSPPEEVLAGAAAVSATSDAAAVSAGNVAVSAVAAASAGAASSGTAVAESGASTSADVASHEALIRHLTTERIKLMVCVDEMESLFVENSEAVRSIIWEIGALATSSTGLTSVVGASSSSFLYPLVKGGADIPPPLATAYFRMCSQGGPLPDMNGDKLKLVTVTPDAPVSLAAVRGFVHSPESVEQLRVASFMYGNHVRSLFVAGQAKPLLCGPMRQLTLNSSSSMPPYASLFMAAYPDTPVVCDAIYDMMYERNKLLLDAVLPQSGAGETQAAAAATSHRDVLRRMSAQVICTTDWQARFKPLTEEDIAHVFASTLPARDLAVEERMLDFLSHDTALIVLIRQLPGSEHYDAYPSSLCALVMHKHGPGSALTPAQVLHNATNAPQRKPAAQAMMGAATRADACRSSPPLALCSC